MTRRRTRAHSRYADEYFRLESKSADKTRTKPWIIASVQQYLEQQYFGEPGESGSADGLVKFRPVNPTVSTLGKLWIEFQAEYPRTAGQISNPTFEKYCKTYATERNVRLMGAS